MPTEILGTVGIIVIALVIILICILSTWKKVPADKAAIVTGLGKAKVVTGGGTVVIPILQRIDYITLENISFDVNMQGTLTADAVPIEANGTVVVKIKNDEVMIRSAVEQFNCGRTEETKQHIMETARDVCEGRLREIIADMTAEQLYKDRKTFSERVKEVAEDQLSELGLELKSFTIKGIGDQNGYFDALSKPQIAAVKRDAEVAQAEAMKESMIKTSEAKRAGEEARLEAEARVAEARKDADIKKLELRERTPDDTGCRGRGVRYPEKHHPEGHHKRRNGRERPERAEGARGARGGNPDSDHRRAEEHRACPEEGAAQGGLSFRKL